MLIVFLGKTRLSLFTAFDILNKFRLRVLWVYAEYSDLHVDYAPLMDMAA